MTSGGGGRIVQGPRAYNMPRAARNVNPGLDCDDDGGGGINELY